MQENVDQFVVHDGTHETFTHGTGWDYLVGAALALCIVLPICLVLRPSPWSAYAHAAAHSSGTLPACVWGEE